MFSREKKRKASQQLHHRGRRGVSADPRARIERPVCGAALGAHHLLALLPQPPLRRRHHPQPRSECKWTPSRFDGTGGAGGHAPALRQESVHRPPHLACTAADAAVQAAGRQVKYACVAAITSFRLLHRRDAPRRRHHMTLIA